MIVARVFTSGRTAISPATFEGEIILGLTKYNQTMPEDINLQVEEAIVSSAHSDRVICGFTCLGVAYVA